jgi:AraC-like DNA-binding protein
MNARMRRNLEKEAALTMALNNPLVPEATLIGLFHDMGITFSTYFVVLLTVENLYQGDIPTAFPSITNHLEGLNTIGIYFQNQVFVYFFLDTHPEILPKDLVDKTVASLENHGMRITLISVGKLHASLLELRAALEEMEGNPGYPTQLQKGVYDSWPLLVKDIMVYIDTHFTEQVTLETLSAKFKISPAYIGSLVKKHTGRKYIDYLTDAKMDMARKLLMDPRYRVEEVANIVGYRNYVTFYKVFVKNTGKSPSNFRNTGFIRSP